MFGNPPNIQKLIEKKDIHGLGKVLVSDKKGFNWDTAREKVLEGLATFAQTDEQAIQALAEAIQHPEASIRRKVIFILENIPHPRSVDALMTVLDDGDYFMRLYAIRGLAKMGNISQKATPKLIAMLENDQPASSALGAIGDPRAIAPLIAYTTRIIPTIHREKNDIRNLNELADAIVALGNLQSAQACSIILQAYTKLSDVHAEAERHANLNPSLRLSNMTIDNYRSILKHTPELDVIYKVIDAKSQAISALKKINITETDPLNSLTAVLESEQTPYRLDIDLDLRQTVAHILLAHTSRLNEKHLWLVAIFTEDESLFNQLHADTTELVALLSAQSGQITQSASKALEKIGGAGDDSQRAVLAVARHDWATAESLGAVAVESLIQKLAYPNHHVRLEAMQTLAKIGDSRAIAPIEALLNEERGVSRDPYLLALHSLGWKATKEWDKVRSACLRYAWDELCALGRIAAYGVQALLPDVKRASDILNTLITILKTDKARVSDEELKSLARLKDVKLEKTVRVYDGDTPYYNDVTTLVVLAECDTIRDLAQAELNQRVLGTN